VDELIRKLQERRAHLMKQADESLAKSGELLASAAPSEERAASLKAADDAYDAAVRDVKDIDAQLERRKAQADREDRAAAARKGDEGAETGRAAGVQITSEPLQYGPGSGHSYFLDMARTEIRRGDGDGGVGAAAERMKRHAQEIDKIMPERRAAVDRRSRQAFEDTFAASPADQQRLRRMERAGISPFEKRFISRTDGQGGYFVPPLWLIDEYVPYLRAGRVFADMWRSFPLPSGTDSINIPRVTTGTGTGPQVSDGGTVPNRDMADNFVNALVRTVAGQQDAAIQLLDQSPVAFDQIIFGDLMADYAMNLSAQLMIGTGTNGQLTGLYSAGTLGSSTGGSSSGYVVNNNANAWTAASGTNNFYVSTGQLMSTIARNRFRPVTGVISNTAVWYAFATSVDSQTRPLVAVNQQADFYNATGEGGDLTSQGPVGHILSAPWSIDPNIPLTFGGTVAPSISTVSSGNVAPTAGSGGNPDYTPLIAAVWDDLYLWEGELRSRTLTEVLSGTLQVRFQVYGYAADMPNRYQNSSGQPVSYGNFNTVGTTSSVLSTAGLLTGF
jgi:HK97 family phage major capsid protein